MATAATPIANISQFITLRTQQTHMRIECAKRDAAVFDQRRGDIVYPTRVRLCVSTQAREFSSEKSAGFK